MIRVTDVSYSPQGERLRVDIECDSREANIALVRAFGIAESVIGQSWVLDSIDGRYVDTRDRFSMKFILAGVV